MRISNGLSPEGGNTRPDHLCDQCPPPKPRSLSLTPSGPVWQTKESLLCLLSYPGGSVERNEEVSFPTVRLEGAVDEWGASPNHTSPPWHKKRTRLFFSHHNEGKAQTWGYPSSWPILASSCFTYSGPSFLKIPMRCDTLLNINFL